jgi:uncharacterized membrane protein YeiH
MSVPPMQWLTLVAVAFMAAAAVLEAGKKRFDLFGMMMIAFTAALGGGTLRDILLDRPVFWVHDQTFLLVALAVSLLTFFLARWIRFPNRFFIWPDAVGLALFTVSGTRAALAYDAPWLVASFLGVVTGVMGGVLRDVLCNEVPLIFREGPLYATVAWLGALVFIMLNQTPLQPSLAALAAGAVIFAGRWVSIRWNIELPQYRDRGE